MCRPFQHAYDAYSPNIPLKSEEHSAALNAPLDCFHIGLYCMYGLQQAALVIINAPSIKVAAFDQGLEGRLLPQLHRVYWLQPQLTQAVGTGSTPGNAAARS